MRINFYDAMLSDDGRTMLVKEKAVNYEAKKMNNPQEIMLMMRSLLHLERRAEEHCYMIALNNSCKILGIFFISKGTVDASLLAPREIYIRALLVGAVQVILCHNHPSGNLTPSKLDISVTKQLKETGELIGIPLLDHIIIGGDSYYSFREQGML